VTKIDTTQLLLSLIGGFFLIVNTVAVALINRYVKDRQMGVVLENGLKNSLGMLQQVAENAVPAITQSLPGVPPSVAPGVQYVLDHVPEAVQHWGLTPQAIAEKIIARIGVKSIETNIAVAASDSPLLPAPVAPVPVNVIKEVV
jgi:hypothetical protein